MSLTYPHDRVAAPKVTAQTLLAKKHSHQPITALTAYDYPTARLVDEAGIDMILSGIRSAWPFWVMTALCR